MKHQKRGARILTKSQNLEVTFFTFNNRCFHTLGVEKETIEFKSEFRD